MAIDPRLYEKYSGRSGDPSSRLGAALSQSAAQRQSLTAAKDKSFLERHLEANLKIKFAMWVIGGVILVVVIIVRAIAR